MKYAAIWGTKGFLISPSKITAMGEFGTTLALKAATSDDTSGTSTTNVRGKELQKMTFTVTYLRAAGVNVRTAVEEWEDLIGKVYPLYIGGKRFGPPKMILTNLDISDVLMSNDGVFLKATVAVTLEEYADGTYTKLWKDMTVATSQAMAATASSSDKSEKQV